MAFTRNWLKSLSLTDEQVSAIIEEHTSVTDGFKKTLSDAKEEAETAKKEAAKVAGLQKELDEYRKGDDYKAKYEQAVKEHEDYVKGIEAKEQAAKVKAAYSKLLADEQIKADRVEFVLNHSDLTNVKLDKDGKITDADGLKKAINDEWGFFKVTTKEKKPNVANPPSEGGAGSGMSRAKELAQKFAQDRYGVKPDTGKE